MLLDNGQAFLIRNTFIPGNAHLQFTYTSNWLGQSSSRFADSRIINDVLGLNLRHLTQQPIGTSVTRTINDVEAINDIFAEGCNHYHE
jgi:hypothetical protein